MLQKSLKRLITPTYSVPDIKNGVLTPSTSTTLRLDPVGLAVAFLAAKC